MSRIIVSRYPTRETHLVVGWDHPCRGAFWQEFCTSEEYAQAEKDMEKAEKTGIGPHSETVKILESECKREGGFFPGIPLEKFEESVPEDLRHLITPQVMALLEAHSKDPDSGYNKPTIDLSEES